MSDRVAIEHLANAIRRVYIEIRGVNNRADYENQLARKLAVVLLDPQYGIGVITANITKVVGYTPYTELWKLDVTGVGTHYWQGGGGVSIGTWPHEVWVPSNTIVLQKLTKFGARIMYNGVQVNSDTLVWNGKSVTLPSWITLVPQDTIEVNYEA